MTNLEVLYCMIHEFSMQIIRGTHDFFSKTYYKKVGFSVCSPSHDLVFFCVFGRGLSQDLKTETTTNNFRSIKVDIILTCFCPPWGKNISIILYQLVGTIFKLERLFPRASLASLLLDQPWSFPFRISSPSLRNDGSSRLVPWPFQPVPGVFRLRSVFGPRKKRWKSVDANTPIPVRCYAHLQLGWFLILLILIQRFLNLTSFLHPEIPVILKPQSPHCRVDAIESFKSIWANKYISWKTLKQPLNSLS